MQTETEDRPIEPVGETVTEETIGTAQTEESQNAVDATPEAPKEEGAKEEGAKEQPEDKGEKDEGKDDAGTRMRRHRDGSVSFLRADGTRVVLAPDEVGRIAQRRIGEATAKQRAAERAAEAAKNAAEEYRQQLEAIAKRREEQGKVEPEEKPTWEGGKWESYDQFQDARDKWNRDQLAREAGQNAPDPEASQLFAQKASAVLEEGVERYGETYLDVVQRNNDAPFDVEFVNFVFSEVDDAAGLLYELGKDVEHAREIRTMLADGKTGQALRALGKLEARIETQSRNDDDDTRGDAPPERNAPLRDESPAPRKRVSKAEEPFTPLQASGPVSAFKNVEEMTQAEYERFRANGGGR